MTVASVVVTVLAIAIATWLGAVLLAYVLRAIGRRLPDRGFELAAEAGHRIGAVQRFEGFDPRPSMRYRRELAARDLKRSREQLRYLDAQLKKSSPARPVSIESGRRAAG